jgi:hypothetical protein
VAFQWVTADSNKKSFSVRGSHAKRLGVPGHSARQATAGGASPVRRVDTGITEISAFGKQFAFLLFMPISGRSFDARARRRARRWHWAIRRRAPALSRSRRHGLRVQWLWTVGLKTAYHLMAGRNSASNRRADDRAVKRVILEFIINGVVVRSPILERGMT